MTASLQIKFFEIFAQKWNVHLIKLSLLGLSPGHLHFGSMTFIRPDLITNTTLMAIFSRQKNNKKSKVWDGEFRLFNVPQY